MAWLKPTIATLNARLNSLALGPVKRMESVSDGCICDNYHLVTARGDHYFLKTCGSAPAGFFMAEACGLNALAASSPLRIPRVIASHEDFLLLEYIAPGSPKPNFWELLAEGLAHMHATAVDQFGFVQDNFCGTSTQPNPACSDGFAFFGQHRLYHQGKLALRQGLLGKAEFEQLEHLIADLPKWIPPSQPALIHGDLWSGNVYCDDTGHPVLIDPACYWGWREADIAMTRLFGQFPGTFYQRYQQCLPMPPGWEQRMHIYNLYHLLNHLNLFGRSYRNAVLDILASSR